MEFLDDNATEDEVVIYAGFGDKFNAFIHGVLVPRAAMNPPDIDDLLNWNCSASGTWGFAIQAQNVRIEPPLASPGSKSLSKAEQIVFHRNFEGVRERQSYVEMLQKFVHVLGLHHMPERNAWCRLDRHGDIEEVVREIRVPEGDHGSGGTIVLVNREILEEYAALTDTVLLRMFTFTRHMPRGYGGPSNEGEAEYRTLGDTIHYRHCVIEELDATWSRGIQIVPTAISRQEAIDATWGDRKRDKKEFATYIAVDWKNKRIAEISCSPDSLGNYYEESTLPHGLTPAFFRPEVLSKYKADREKYHLEERYISCRGSWSLEYDINEAGQVHAYLIDLGRLPYEEQLHWKQFNEEPKGSISDRSFTTDFQGEWLSSEDSPLENLKNKLRKLDCPWWTLRTEEAIDRAQYPVTGSNDEWRNEILALDQLLVEGFEERRLRAKAKELGRSPKQNLRSLGLAEECLIGLGFEEEQARSIVAPLRNLHHHRSKIQAHVSGTEAKTLKEKAFRDYGGYSQHYRQLVADCDSAMEDLMEAFQDSRMG